MSHENDGDFMKEYKLNFAALQSETAPMCLPDGNNMKLQAKKS